MRTGDDYTDAKRIFLEAVELVRSERAGFVDARCAHDPALAARVRGMLAADDDSAFLGAPPAALGTSPASTPTPSGLAAGTVLGGGRYRIVRPLGEGGMGIVYEAEQDEPARRVALKIIHPGFLSDALRSRFRHEIRVLGQLRHPGIAQIYDAGTLETDGGAGRGVPYFAMELIAGRPPLECAQALKLGVRERLELVAQVCDAVHHAHQKGVVHRDLKPANILVEEAGSTVGDAGSGRSPLQVKVLDFGVARLTDADVRAVTIQTSVQQLVGTVPYMSPEQAAADPEGVDIRTDVYSIGVVAFELLAGRLPHLIQGRGLHEAMRAIREDEPARLSSIDRSLRGDIDTIVAKALERDRDRRYGSAAEMAADIRRFLSHAPITARPPSALYYLRTYARRHKPLVVAAGVALAAMVGGTVFSTWQAMVAFRAKDSSERNAAEARREASRASLAAASAALSQGDPIGARTHLDAADADARGWAWQYWNARHDRSIALMEPGEPIAGAWFADDDDEGVTIVTERGALESWDPWRGARPGSARLAAGPVRLAVRAGAGEVVAIHETDPASVSVGAFDATDGRLIRPIAASLPLPTQLAASDAGRVIAALFRGAPDYVLVWTLSEASGPQSARVAPGARLLSLALSANGRTLGASNAVIALWSLGAPEASPPTQLGIIPIEWATAQLCLSADGRIALTGGRDRLVTLWNATNITPLASGRGHAGRITGVVLDPSSRLAASVAADLTIRTWDAQAAMEGAGREGPPIVRNPTREPEPDAPPRAPPGPDPSRLEIQGRSVLTGLSSPADRIAFSRDGSRLLSVSLDGSVRLWMEEPEEGVSVLRGHTGYVYAVAFTPDGSRIVSGAWDETIRVWDAASGESLRVIPTGAGFVTALAMPPDGRTIVSGHQRGWWTGGAIHLWDAATGAHRSVLRPEGSPVTAFAFAPDGASVIVSTKHAEMEARSAATGAATPGFAPDSKAGCAVAFSPDGDLLASGHESGRLCIRDAATGAVLRTLNGHTGAVRALAFRPAGGGAARVGGAALLLASGSDDSTVRLWDAGTGACLAILERHWDKVYAVAFTPDGSTLATGSDDTTVRIWDVPTREEITQLRGHEAYVYSLAFSPDGRMLASGSGDGTVRVWDTRPVRERWRARAADDQTP
ncbi:MAG: WD40 repeat domain-containing serine/threonine protein kinase [Phycisphaerales bacterium]